VNRAVGRVYECSLPTVAKIDGPAFGAGAGLAIACDIQLASPEAKISFGFRRVGLALDSGVSFLLPASSASNTAKGAEVFTGELVSADRARELGVFTRVFESHSFEGGRGESGQDDRDGAHRGPHRVEATAEPASRLLRERLGLRKRWPRASRSVLATTTRGLRVRRRAVSPTSRAGEFGKSFATSERYQFKTGRKKEGYSAQSNIHVN